MSGPFFDTHCHLDSLKAFSTEEVLAKCQEMNVTKIITVAVDPSNLDQVILLAKTYDHVYCTQGVHPHEAASYNESVHEKIRLNATRENKVVAIGETGLDFHYDHSPREVQKEVFLRQLDLACELDLPVVIHTREADPETIEILEQYGPRLKRKGVIHSFTGSKELATKALDLGFYLGFNGIITFKNADNIRSVLEMAPITRILFETDAPYLTPVPHRGKENGPYFLSHVGEKVAQVKNLAAEELFDQVFKNSMKLFFNVNP